MHKARQIISTSVAQTHSAARELANTSQNGDIYCLTGPLGAGKSEFARAFIQHLMGAAIDVPSPTFTLVQTYDTSKGTIYHFDLYRIEEPDDIYEIGWEEALSDRITLIEWPERLGPLMPAEYTDIKITPESKESRKITIEKQSGSPR